MTNITRILNCNILRISEKELLEKLTEGVLITPNVDHLVKMQSDRDFYDCYSGADWIICDSKILYVISKLLPMSLPEAIPGSSFFTHFYEYHKYDNGCKIFLLGAKEGVAETAKQKINEKLGRNIIVGAYSPSFGFENRPDEINSIISIVNESGANVVLVGLGAPKQEKFIMKYKNDMPGVGIWMALGATIDFEAGNIKRAPLWMQKMCIEWLYRLIKEPKRMFKRYIVDDLKFFWYFIEQLLGIYKDPFA